ncbi:MAG: hypothetical protein WEC39_00460 [Patescibacteria group bacterium]
MLGYYYYTSKIRPYLTEPQRASYTLLGFTVLVLFLFGFFIFFMTRETLVARQELKEGRSYEAALAEKITSLGQAKQNIAAVLPQLNKLEVNVPTTAAQPQLIGELYGDAASAGVTLTNISFPTGREDSATSLRFNLNALGSYAAAQQFLAQLEDGRLLVFDRIQVTGRGTENLWDINVSGRTLHLR